MVCTLFVSTSKYMQTGTFPESLAFFKPFPVLDVQPYTTALQSHSNVTSRGSNGNFHFCSKYISGTDQSLNGCSAVLNAAREWIGWQLDTSLQEDKQLQKHMSRVLHHRTAHRIPQHQQQRSLLYCSTEEMRTRRWRKTAQENFISTLHMNKSFITSACNKNIGNIYLFIYLILIRNRECLLGQELSHFCASYFWGFGGFWLVGWVFLRHSGSFDNTKDW